MVTDPLVLGLDLSLATPALATPTRAWHRAFKTRGDGYPERLTRLQGTRSWVLDQLLEVRPALLVLEGPAPNATQRVSSWDRAKLWWDVLEAATETFLPVAIVPPSSVKKFATGNGGCKKEAMIAAAYKRLPGLEVEDDNEADAAWLMAMGRAQLGAPLCELPRVQTAALLGVVWPTVAGVVAA